MGMVAVTDQHFNPLTGNYEENQTLKVFEWNRKHIEEFKSAILRIVKDEFNENYKGIQVYRQNPDGDDMFRYNFPFQMYFYKDYSKLYLDYTIPDAILLETDKYYNFYQILNNRFYQLAKLEYGWELRVVTKDLYVDNPKVKNRYVEVYHKKMPIYTAGLWFNKVKDRYEFLQDKVVFNNMITKTTLNMTERERDQLMQQYFSDLVEINKRYHLTGAQTAAKNAYSDYKSLMSDLFDVTLPDTAINKCEYWYFEVELLGTLEDREAMNERIV